MTEPPVFDQQYAACDKCELKTSCDRHAYACGVAPSKPFNDIMIVGEAPDQHAVNAHRPFMGRQGVLLRQILESAGIDMDACWLTNAVLCKPPFTEGKGSLVDRFPHAVHSCLGRLESEIAFVKPRVVVAMGNAALIAMTGKEVTYKKRVPFACSGGCDEKRRIGPVYQCGKCKHVMQPISCVFEADTAAGGECLDCGAIDTGEPSWCIPPQNCPECDSRASKLKLKMIKCTACGGLKTREEELVDFEYDYKIGEIAGMVVPSSRFGWDQFGVKYIIPTFHPSFLLIPAKPKGSGEKKVMAGQFAAYSVQKHLQKALLLSREDQDWSFEYDITAGDGKEAAARLRGFYNDVLASTEHEITQDIETEAWGTAYYCTACNKKVRTIGEVFVEERTVTEVCPNCTKLAYAVSVEIDLESIVAVPAEDSDASDDADSEADEVPEVLQRMLFGVLTQQKTRLCERDARILEEVTKIKCIGFASRVLRRACVVDTRDMRIDSPLYNELRWLVTQEPELGHVFHHGTYDVPVMAKLWDIPWKEIIYTGDTLIKHHETHADETHTLGHLAGRYTTATMWKPPKKRKGASVHETFDELAEYNARDVMVTADSSAALDAEIVSENMEELRTLDMSLQMQGLDMMHNGIPLNIERAKEVGAEALEKRAIALAGMRKYLNDPTFNPDSGPQLQKALFETLANPVSAWTDGGKSGIKKPSTSKDALVVLEDTPFKRYLLEYKDVGTTLRNNFVITYDESGRAVPLPGRALNLWSDGRIHARWKPYGTVTGRYSSSPNFQNFQEWLKRMMEVPEGRVIVSADFDQLELRILAMLSGDENLIQRCMTADDKRKLEPDCDPHSYVASYVFAHFIELDLKDARHITDKKVKCKCQTCHRKQLRELCKRVIYGLNYGAGEDVVLASIYKGGYYGPPVTKEMIRKVKQIIFELFPGVLIWRQMMVEQATETRELRDALTGRRREFALGDIPITEIANFPIQSTGAAIVNDRASALYAIHKQLDPSALYIAQIHDAIYYEVDEKCSLPFAEAMTKTLTCWRTYKGSEPMLFSASADIVRHMGKAG